MSVIHHKLEAKGRPDLYSSLTGTLNNALDCPLYLLRGFIRFGMHWHSGLACLVTFLEVRSSIYSLNHN